MLRAIALAIVLAACGGEAEAGGYVDEYGGSSAVYDRIAALTDCGELQDEFDQAAENNDREDPDSELHSATLGYMVAAEDRRQELGC